MPPLVDQWRGVQFAAESAMELRDLVDATSSRLTKIDHAVAKKVEQQRAELQKGGANILQRAGVNPGDFGW
jgi:hypothetical protein